MLHVKEIYSNYYAVQEWLKHTETYVQCAMFEKRKRKNHINKTPFIVN